VADAVFAAGAPATADAWLGVLAYAFQIYFDFSGYSDMAIGLGLVLGFVLPRNFDDPYQADSITDFWRRWHITLSSWLRDYLYVPLGGNRCGRARTYVNLMIVMLLGGLWHGADWKFVVWGGWHGAWLAIERARGGRAVYAALPRPARVACTFGLVLAGWVLFRAASLADAGRLFARLAGLGEASDTSALAGAVVHAPYLVGTMAVAALIVWRGPGTLAWTAHLSTPRLAALAGTLALALAALATQSYNPFIYFIF
jgi:alginate O-acetyltransferase complex protein AlgI